MIKGLCQLSCHFIPGRCSLCSRFSEAKMLPAARHGRTGVDFVIADQESSNTLPGKEGEKTGRLLTSRLVLGRGPRKSETTRLPGSLRSGGIRLIGKVLIKDDTLGRQQDQILTAGKAYANTVGVPSTENPSLLRVAPSDPANSYLYRKITGAGITGDRMPQGGPYLTDAQTKLVRDWIRRGAPND